VILKRIEAPQGAKVGGWFLLDLATDEPGRCVCVRCPACFKDTTLGGHTVLRTGEVHGSVVCVRGAACFHQNVILSDWPSDLVKRSGQLRVEVAS
jgi:hypothetical protein